MKLFKTILPFLVTLCIIGIFYFTNIIWFKYYPPLINFIIFCIFFVSLFQKYTIIQRFAFQKKSDVGAIVLNYTRNITYVWAIFTFLNFLVSFGTVFMNEKIWAIYNGFISYLLVGCIFMIEYCIRLRVIRRENRI